MQVNDEPQLLPSRREMERAFTQKDASYDGVFYTAVRTTGIFCRPSCVAKPKLENTEFFATVKECLFAGYRACKRCDPLSANGERPAWVNDLMDRVRLSDTGRLQAQDLRELGLTPERVRRWFMQNLGMTFADWCRGQRLAGAFDRLREGMKLDDVAFESGFESHSGFRDAVTKIFGTAPGRLREEGNRIVIQMIESPIGPLLVGATEDGICLLEFTDRRMLETNLATIRKRFGRPIVPGTHPWLTQLQAELKDYFEGKRQNFTVPLAPEGTKFQEQVWTALRGIPFGETIAYDELARRVDRPTAQRAVANANGQNRISIIIPCHRVIGKDGSLTGYGGGLWRKRLLLELEKTGKLPGR
ncbi:MAG TPA: methylated-DNA--[protein]-cysteine S-methyltransferase [Candidatus Limnocylindria bacterium]|jgi:AraC family transcriptional regulator of adaptative response/methylated-DNA-[protein]-cysteine methyltransferase|nr:methylated-DNA--[protein]-cysteine S-methyltransferase [Candidatus Limnocylindria bacterium]